MLTSSPGVWTTDTEEPAPDCIEAHVFKPEMGSSEDVTAVGQDNGPRRRDRSCVASP